MAFTQDSLAQAFTAHRERLLALVRKNLNPVLLKRMSYEDVLQSAYAAAAKRLAYFAANEEVPVYFKLRTALLQTLADLARRHLQSAGRDAFREVPSCELRGGNEDGQTREIEFAANTTSPVSRVDRNERHALLRQAVAALPAATSTPSARRCWGCPPRSPSSTARRTCWRFSPRRPPRIPRRAMRPWRRLPKI